VTRGLHAPYHPCRSEDSTGCVRRTVILGPLWAACLFRLGWANCLAGGLDRFLLVLLAVSGWVACFGLASPRAVSWLIMAHIASGWLWSIVSLVFLDPRASTRTSTGSSKPIAALCYFPAIYSYSFSLHWSSWALQN